MTRIAATAALLLVLTGCTAPDAHAPPFARVPFEPFSRTAAVAVARQEWRLWGSPVVDQTEAHYHPISAQAMPERQPGLWQEVGLYWWIGQNAGNETAGWTGKHDASGTKFSPAINGRYAWSAAFISYVMRMAGAGPAFPYAPDHAYYIDYAARAAAHLVSNPLLIARDPKIYAPRLGDLLCLGRGRASSLTFADLPTRQPFPAHCALVVGGAPGDIDVIGGNIDDEVALTHVPADHAGLVDDRRFDWFVILQVLYKR